MHSLRHLLSSSCKILMLALMTASSLKAVDPFKMVIIGDTQRYPQVINAGGPDLFTVQTQWIKDNAVAENIVFVTHVGDVIQDNAALWVFADEAISKLDGAVPYSITFGNHDGGAPNVFGASRYSSYPWYQGSSIDELAHAQTFSGGGIDFLHINLPWNPKTTHLTWAQGIINTHPGKPTIISTHGYLKDNGYGRQAIGNTIWNNLVNNNAQVFMTCCGHDWVPRHEVDTTTDGRKIIQLMMNLQEITNGGNSFFQNVIFDPDNSEIRVNTYSPYHKIFRTDYTGQFKFSATFGTSSVTVNGETGPTQKRWNGSSSGNGNWMTATNWDGTATVIGNLLKFPNVTNKNTINDFPSGSSFKGIVLEQGIFSGGYSFSGNQITLTGDIVNMGGYGPNITGSGPTFNLPINLMGDRQINTGEWDMTINGVISGNGSLTKTHGRDYINGSYDGGIHIGDLYLTNINTYTGNTSITGGALILDNVTKTNLMPLSPAINLYYNTVLKVTDLQNGTLVLASGQALQGTGKVIGKTSAPTGTSIGPGHNSPGKLFQIGDLSMDSGSALDIEVGGATGKDTDQVDITGSVNLGGSTLNLSQHNAFTPQVGNTFLLVNNDEQDAVIGEFVSGVGSHLDAGTALPEGTIVSNNFLSSGFSAQISYLGGTGNDVTITVLPAPGPPVFINDPLSTKDAEVDKPYNDSISDSALDGDGDALTYSKLSGPTWLSVSLGGNLTGTPDTGTLGVNTFVVKVTDSNGDSNTATLNITVIAQNLVGRWDFDDPSDLTLATVGTDLTLVGSDQAITGVSGADGAARVEVDSHYICSHGIAANGGGSAVNEYTIVLDLKYPSSSTNTWRSILQTTSANNNDGDLFFRNSNNTIGIAAVGYSSYALATDTWSRIAVSVDNGGFFKIYADGVLILNGTTQAIDDRFSLESTLLFFADNNGEDNTLDVSTILLYDSALSSLEIAALGSVDQTDSDGDGIPDAVDLDDDNDGIPDAWETAHMLDPFVNDGSSDSDKDGHTNAEEYETDTDPKDAKSFPKTGITMNSSGNPVISFQSSSNRYYTLEYCENLVNQSWTKIGQPFLGNGSLMSVSGNDPLATTQGFYRVTINLP